MSKADDEIAAKVSKKLQEQGNWTDNLIKKIVSYIKTGQVDSASINLLVDTEIEKEAKK
jgi:hypothetical protein